MPRFHPGLSNALESGEETWGLLRRNIPTMELQANPPGYSPHDATKQGLLVTFVPPFPAASPHGDAQVPGSDESMPGAG